MFLFNFRRNKKPLSLYWKDDLLCCLDTGRILGRITTDGRGLWAIQYWSPKRSDFYSLDDLDFRFTNRSWAVEALEKYIQEQ